MIFDSVGYAIRDKTLMHLFAIDLIQDMRTYQINWHFTKYFST